MTGAPPILPTDLQSNLGRQDPITFFPRCERERVAEGARRYAILMEDVEVEAEKHISRFIPLERRRNWGPPDTSSLPLAVVSRAMATPGHYAQEPALDGPGAAVVADLLSSGGLWQLAQHAEYLAYGMGSCLRYIDLPASIGRLVYDAIPHHYVWADAHPDDRRRPVTIYRLRRRVYTRPGMAEPEARYAWDIHSVADPANPFFAIRIAEPDGVIGADITAQIVGLVDGQPASFVGEAYPWRDESGPFLPYEIQRREDCGDMWAWQLGKSACLGTLNSIVLATVANHVAINSSGSNKMVAGGTPTGAQVTTGLDGQRRLSVQMEYGEVMFLKFDEGVTNLSAVDVGNSGNLEALKSYGEAYKSQIATDLGVPPRDPRGDGANPASGLAMGISNAVKRDEQRRMAPLCRAVDAGTIAKSVALARNAGLIQGDPGAVTVRYHEIEKSPEEQRAERESLDWDLSHGQRSAIDVYMERNPGTTRDDAIAALARIAQDAQVIAEAAGTSGTKAEKPLVGVVTAVAERQNAVRSGLIGKAEAKAFLVKYGDCTVAEADALIDPIVVLSTPPPVPNVATPTAS